MQKNENLEEKASQPFISHHKLSINMKSTEEILWVEGPFNVERQAR